MLLHRLNKVIKSVILVGFIGLIFTSSSNLTTKVSNENLTLTLNLESMAMRVKEEIANDIYSAKESYSGYLTGYGADCPLCGGTLACMPGLDVLHGNVTYDDKTYGTVNIVASSKNVPCGTILRINDYRNSNGPMYAIVLDRGVGGYNLDLLTINEAYAYQNVGRSIVNYDVLRRGW